MIDVGMFGKIPYNTYLNFHGTLYKVNGLYYICNTLTHIHYMYSVQCTLYTAQLYIISILVLVDLHCTLYIDVH